MVSQKNKADRARPPHDTPAALDRGFVEVDSLRAEGDETSCLRPLGLCELGGCCDICWYSPKHPRFQDK